MRARVCAQIAKLDLEKEWQVTIDEYKEHRSLNQNSLMWMWIGIIARSTGNTPDEVHDSFKDMFLVPKEYFFMGEKRLHRSSALLDTQEMSEYLDRIHAWAGSWGIILPVPEDQAT